MTVLIIFPVMLQTVIVTQDKRL